MPMVDFTLEDVRAVVYEIVDERLDAKLEEKLDAKLSAHFMDFIENNFTPAMEDIDEQFDDVRGRLDRLETDVKGIKRLVRKHSADIAELQAQRGI
jgi:archaellum component FlaC